MVAADVSVEIGVFVVEEIAVDCSGWKPPQAPSRNITITEPNVLREINSIGSTDMLFFSVSQVYISGFDPYIPLPLYQPRDKAPFLWQLRGWQGLRNNDRVFQAATTLRYDA